MSEAEDLIREMTKEQIKAVLEITIEHAIQYVEDKTDDSSNPFDDLIAMALRSEQKNINRRVWRQLKKL